jgi:thiol-disulfide isomerase/thioredoxin
MRRMFMWLMLAMVLAGSLGVARGQTPVLQQESGSQSMRPGEIYQQAMKPLDLVRSSLDNWSDAELGALGVGIRMARQVCGQARLEVKPEGMLDGDVGSDHDVILADGEDLFDLIRLCALGQDWNKSHDAAVKYLASNAAPHRTQAYAMSINALVHVNDLEGAVKTARQMLGDVPYDAEVAYAMQFLKTYLTQAVDPAALALSTEDHGVLVKALENGSTLKVAPGEASMGAGLLFASGMQLAFLQRYAGDERGAERTCAELIDAVGKANGVGAADRQLMELVRRQYALLGTVLPEIDGQMLETAATGGKTAKLRFDSGSVTVVALFPDYCPQCAKTMEGLTEFAAEHVAAKVRAAGLMVMQDGEGHPQENAKNFKGTSTMLVSANAAAGFGAIDYPLVVVTDEKGLVYFVGTIPQNAFVPNGYMEQVVGRIVGETITVRNRAQGKAKVPSKK